MASTLSKNIQIGDDVIFEEIINYAYSPISTESKSLLKQMVHDGVLQIEILVEQAISACANLIRESTVGRDFEDGSDAKKAITVDCFDTYSYRRVAKITNLQNKEGLLRCVVAETLTSKVYYFAIPHYAYEGLKQIAIYFNEDGTPKLDGKWFEYACKNFEEMANA